MARSNRSSKPGFFQHTVSRGVGQRPLFETEGDYLYFERLMRRTFEAEDRGAQLVCYVLMPNHVHEILGGEQDGISKGMQSQLQPYTQWFNKRRGRDGPLFSQRFHSTPLDSGVGLVRTVRYLDQNPVQAGLVKFPQEYAWGSARGYLNGALPSWMDSSLVRLHLKRDLTAGETLAQAYQMRICKPMSSREFSELELRIQRAHLGRELNSGSLEYSSPSSLQWYEERAQLADGFTMLSGRLIVHGEVEAFLRKAASCEDLRGMAARPLRGVGTWLELARLALLHRVCCLHLRELAKITDVADSTITRRLRRHATMLEEAEGYRVFFTLLVARLEQETAWF